MKILRKAMVFDDSLMREIQAKSFASTTAHADTLQMNALNQGTDQASKT